MCQIIRNSFFLFFLVNCSFQGKVFAEIENNEICQMIDLKTGFDNSQTVRLSDIADSVAFVPFETTKASLMGVGQKSLMSFSNQFIFYYKQYFDWNGKYYGEIVKIGQGTFEEIYGGQLLYKDNHFYSKGGKLIEYDRNGKPTGKVRNLANERASGRATFLFNGVTFFSAGDNFAVYDYPTTLYFFDRNFETVSFSVITPCADSMAHTFIPPSSCKYVTYYKDMALFYNFMNDTIFQVVNTGLIPRWVVNFDHPLRLQNEVLLDDYNLRLNNLLERRKGISNEKTDYVKLAEHKHMVTEVHETESSVYFLMTEIIRMAEPRGLVHPDPYIMRYDKKTGKTVRIKGKGFVDDLLGMDYFYPQLGFFDQKMINFIWPYELLDYIEDSKKKGREINPRILDLSKKIDSEDNPILILVYLKK